MQTADFASQFHDMILFDMHPLDMRVK